MRSQSILLLFFLLLTQGFANSTAQSSSAPLSFFTPPAFADQMYSSIPITIVLDSTLSDIDFAPLITSYNNSERYNGGPYQHTYQYQIFLEELTVEEHNAFVTYLRTIEDDSENNGHTYNHSLYQQGLADEVFQNASGKSYDAEQTLSWIEDNLWEEKQNSYTLYVFNLTELSPDGDHWFKINPLDIDSKIENDGFYGGTKGIVNGKQVSAWGGSDNRPLHFVDLSSSVWFGDFINQVWGSSGYYDTTIEKTIEDISNDVDLSVWATNYVRSFIENLFFDLPFMGTPISFNVDVSTLVFYNWSRYNISMADSQWIISDEIMEEKLEQGFPWMNFAIDTIWHPLEFYPDIISEVQKYVEYDEDRGTNIIEVTRGFLAYLTNEVIPMLRDTENPNLQLPSLVFLLDDITFTYYDTAFSGLGGMGFQLQGIRPERVLKADDSRDRGLSKVLLHEIGHSLGLPHPFNTNDRWASDFSASLMGYYTSWSDFSIYDTNKLGRYHTGYYFSLLEYLERNTSPSDELVISALASRDAALEIVEHSWNFSLAMTHIAEAFCSFAKYANSPDDPVCDIAQADDLVSSVLTSSTITSTTTSMSESESQPSSASFLFPIPFLIAVFINRVITKR